MSILSDEVRPSAAIAAIAQYLHETADAKGRKRLLALFKEHGQELAEGKAKDSDESTE